MKASYLLIDTTLIGHPANKPWLKKRRKPSWVASLYGREAVGVSPILIDLERAVICNRLNAVMEMVNARHPQLGVSFIESALSLRSLCAHFQKFTYVQTSAGSTLTLRFADCAVLPALWKVLTDDQWGAIVAPVTCWKIHGRDGRLITLPTANSASVASTPLHLSDGQIVALKDEMGTDQLLVNLRLMRPAPTATYATLTAYEYAYQARRLWRDAGHREGTDLVLFARDVFDTEGRLLRVPSLRRVLEQTDLGRVRADLKKIVSMQYP